PQPRRGGAVPPRDDAGRLRRHDWQQAEGAADLRRPLGQGHPGRGAGEGACADRTADRLADGAGDRRQRRGGVDRDQEPRDDPERKGMTMGANPEIVELTADLSASPYYNRDMAPVPA